MTRPDIAYYVSFLCQFMSMCRLGTSTSSTQQTLRILRIICPSLCRRRSSSHRHDTRQGARRRQRASLQLRADEAGVLRASAQQYGDSTQQRSSDAQSRGGSTARDPHPDSGLPAGTCERRMVRTRGGHRIGRAAVARYDGSFDESPTTASARGGALTSRSPVG